MRSTMPAAVLAMTLAATCAVATAQTTPPKTYDVRDFFRKPERSTFRLAPDGRHLAFLGKRNGRQNVFVQALDADGAPVGDATPLTDESARDISTYFWKGPGHVVYAKDFGGDENFHVLSVAIDGRGDVKRLQGRDGYRLRVGRYRVLFGDDGVTVLAVHIGTRQTTTYG